MEESSRPVRTLFAALRSSEISKAIAAAMGRLPPVSSGQAPNERHPNFAFGPGGLADVEPALVHETPMSTCGP